jgi:hypothetical protein
LPTVAAAEDDDEDVAGSVDGDEVEMEPVEPMLEPPDDAGPVGWPMPDFCPLTVSALGSLLCDWLLLRSALVGGTWKNDPTSL